MAKKIVLIFCVVMVCCVPFAHGAMLLDKVMAIVNKEVITWSELYKGMEFDATDQVKSMKSEDKRKLFKENEMLFLENMIDMKLQLQEAAKSGVVATDEDVARTINGIKGKYSMTDEMFRDAINKEGFTLSEYKRKLSEQITASRIVEQDVKGKILVTEAEIDKYLSEHRDAAKENEGFSISHIVLRKDGDKKQIEEKARDIYKRAVAGESFPDLALKYSEDANAKSGGDLGFVRKSDLSGDFLRVLAAMKAGEVSEPFWSENGIHILKVNEVMAFKDPQEFREAVRQKLLNDKFNVSYKSWLKSLREKAYIEIK